MTGARRRVPDQPTKRCPRCKQTLPLSSYRLRKTTTYTDNGAIMHPAGSPQGYCKTCQIDHKRELNRRNRAIFLSHA